MKPITRKEYYLAKAAGTYTGPTPPPVLREDYYLATLAGDYSGNCPAPVTRIEKYMSAAAGLTSYVPQPVTRVEKYWYAIAKGTGYVPEPVTREEHFLYEIITAGPKYIDKIAEGSLILLTDSAEAPLTALTVYGHSTQSGTPSPENPVPIVSAGDSGEINVNVGGKNLIPFPYLSPLSGAGTVYEADGVTYTVQADGGIKCVGTPTNQFGPSLCNIRFSDLQINAQSGSGTVGEITLSGGPLYYDSKNNKTFIYWNLYLNTPVDMTIYPQVEYGTVATAYEPYKTPQTLTLSTPGGLPGIPVTSGGNYTDADGQQWICDEVDFKRGVYVQRIIRYTGPFYKMYWAQTDSWFVIASSLANIPKPSYKGFCNISDYYKSSWDNLGHSHWFLQTGGQQIVIHLGDTYNTEEAVEQFIEKNEIVVYYAAETPIETDLPAEEIAAYKALHTYSPTTTVSNDAEAWMKVEYKAIP